MASTFHDYFAANGITRSPKLRRLEPADCFAALALCLTVISFPLMLDRDVGLIPAAAASLRLSRECPIAVALWGLIVAAALVVASLPLFVGLAVAMPTLGHATWRFYRRAVERDRGSSSAPFFAE